MAARMQEIPLLCTIDEVPAIDLLYSWEAKHTVQQGPFWINSLKFGWTSYLPKAGYEWTRLCLVVCKSPSCRQH